MVLSVGARAVIIFSGICIGSSSGGQVGPPRKVAGGRERCLFTSPGPCDHAGSRAGSTHMISSTRTPKRVGKNIGCGGSLNVAPLASKVALAGPLTRLEPTRHDVYVNIMPRWFEMFAQSPERRGAVLAALWGWQGSGRPSHHDGPRTHYDHTDHLGRRRTGGRWRRRQRFGHRRPCSNSMCCLVT